MGSNRKRPFGYKMEFGEIVLHPAEAETVRWIYDHYLAGASYNALVDKLRERGIPYDGDKPWNKNMAARILADRRYTGEGGFPSIIPEGHNALPKEPSPEGTAEAVRRQPAGLGGTAGTGSPEPPDPAPRAHCLPSPRGQAAVRSREAAPRTGRAPAPPAGG